MINRTKTYASNHQAVFSAVLEDDVDHNVSQSEECQLLNCSTHLLFKS